MLEPAVAQVMAASSSTAKFPDGLDEETLDQTDLDKKLALALAESLKRKKRKLPSPVKHEEQRSTKKRTLPSPPELLHVKREDQPEQPETIEIPMPPPSDSDTEESPVQEKDKEMSHYRYWNARRSVKNEYDWPGTDDAQGLQDLVFEAETHDDVGGQMTKEPAVISMAGHADSQDQKESTQSSSSRHGDNQKNAQTVKPPWMNPGPALPPVTSQTKAPWTPAKKVQAQFGQTCPAQPMSAPATTPLPPRPHMWPSPKVAAVPKVLPVPPPPTPRPQQAEPVRGFAGVAHEGKYYASWSNWKTLSSYYLDLPKFCFSFWEYDFGIQHQEMLGGKRSYERLVRQQHRSRRGKAAQAKLAYLREMGLAPPKGPATTPPRPLRPPAKTAPVQVPKATAKEPEAP